MLLCGIITCLKRVDRACASEILHSKYIAGLFKKRMKDVILELYMLLCFVVLLILSCITIHMTDNLPTSFYSHIGLYQIHNPSEMNITILTKTELATT